MRLKCLHGYFILSESKSGQVSDFMSLTGLSIESKKDYFTFSDLVDAPHYSIIAKPIQIGLVPLPAIATFEGEPWEVLEQNEMVYDFSRGLLVPIVSITKIIKIQNAGNKFISNGLIIPGSLTDEGQRVKSYDAYFIRESMKWVYTEVEYV